MFWRESLVSRVSFAFMGGIRTAYIMVGWLLVQLLFDCSGGC